MLLVLGVLVGALCSPKVQTAAVQLVTSELSRGIGACAKIESIEYRFPARLRIQGIYIEDQQRDTLLYIDEVYAHFRPLSLLDNRISFSEAHITTARANIHQLPSGEYNYQFLADLIPESNDTTESEFNQLLSIENVTLSDLQLRYDDWYAELEHAAVALHYFNLDSLDAEIKTLCGQTVHEKERFVLEDLQARLILNDTLLVAPTLYVKLPHSTLDASGVHVDFPQGDTLYLTESAQDIRASLHINTAIFCPRDLSLFLPDDISSIDKPFSFMGDLKGSLDSLSATNLALYYAGHRLILGDITTVGLPDWKHMYVTANCQDLSVNTGIAQDFISDLKDHPYRLPQELTRIGEAHYRGTVKGRISDLQLHGAFRTALGSISTDGRLRSDSTFMNMDFSGSIATRRFKLSRLLPESGLGTVSLDVRANGSVREGGFPSGEVHAHVEEFGFKDYTYHDICLQGRFGKQQFDGILTIDDENLKLRFEGLADRSSAPNYNFDLRLAHFAPQHLHLIEPGMEFSASTHVNLSGFDPDKLSGYLVVDSLKIKHDNDSLLMRQFKLIADCDTLSPVRESQKSIQITSDYLTAKINGKYAYTTLLTSLQKQAVKYLPSLFSDEQIRHIQSQPSHNNLDFYVYGRELKQLQKVLRLTHRIADYPVLKGYFHESEGQFGVQAYTENIRSRSNRINDITFSLDNQNAPLTLGFSFSIPADSFIVGHAGSKPEPIFIPTTDVALRAQALADSVVINLNVTPDHTTLDHANAYYSEGDIGIATYFSRYAGKPLYTVHFHPDTLLYLGTPYSIAEGSISYCVADTLLTINNFRIGNDNHYIEADGLASTRMSDTLSVRLAHVEASDLLPIVLPEKTLTVQGDVNGWGRLYGLFSTPMFEAGAHLIDAGLNGMRLGDVVATVGLDKENNTIVIHGDVTDSTHLVAHVDGLVEPAEKAWRIDIQPDSIGMSFINHWTQGFLTDIDGYASGQVSVFGRYGDTWVTAAVQADGAGLTIPYTGCHYTFSDSAYLDSTSISFPKMTLYDTEGNKLLLDGKLTHKCFTEFVLNLHAQPQHCLAFDLPEKKGEMLAGHVYADGEVFLYGHQDDIHLDATAQSVGKSRFRFSIDGASNAHDNSFITFVHHEEDDELTAEEEDEFASLIAEEEKVYRPDAKFTLGLNIDATPELLFQLCINEATGDVIQARGEGGLRVSMDGAGDISLVGTYTLQSGSLGFTIGNMIRRDFVIAEGSQIAWSGNPEKPMLDVTAKYQVTASLRDLFGDEISALNTTRTSIPVACCVTMSGSLDNPTIRFALEFPMSEEAIRDQVRSVINTEEMMMRQVVYLLVFGRFFTPEYMKSSTTAGLNEMYSLLSSTITGQINSWLGKLTNVFSMGVNIRTDGEGASSSQEYEAQFQLQPIDRLVINGNVGYRYNDISGRPFFGDVDVEYMLTPNGKVRVKGYTHTVDKYSLRQAATIQGVGFVFRHDFNWPEKKKKKKDKTKTPTAQ